MTVDPQAPSRAATGHQMKRRSPAASWIGLPLITLGIYYFVWYAKIHRELGEFDPRYAGSSPAGAVCSQLFGGLTLGIWTLINIAGTAGRIANAQRAAGLTPSCGGGVAILLCFLLGTHVIYFQSNINKITDAYQQVPAGEPLQLRA
ncbi:MULTISPECIES: DUF4234 domain-containing protein [Streptomonospora]|uniref:DUF4234 domain-containing protein n=2 Tax=Streptomonospora TaxID=104204 RepID=A0ABV9SPB6_9ACTN